MRLLNSIRRTNKGTLGVLAAFVIAVLVVVFFEPPPEAEQAVLSEARKNDLAQEGPVQGGFMAESEQEALAAEVQAFEEAFHHLAWSDTAETRAARIRPHLADEVAEEFLAGADLSFEDNPAMQAWTDNRYTQAATVERLQAEFFDPQTAFVTTIVRITETDEDGETVAVFDLPPIERNWIKTVEGWRLHSNAETTPVDL